MNRQTMNALLSSIGESDVAVPEGYLYAGMMSVMGLQEFQAMIDVLTKVGLITREAGPTIRPTRKLLDTVASCKAEVSRG